MHFYAFTFEYWSLPNSGQNTQFRDDPIKRFYCITNCPKAGYHGKEQSMIDIKEFAKHRSSNDIHFTSHLNPTLKCYGFAGWQLTYNHSHKRNCL